jgi:hypothetical protein
MTDRGSGGKFEMPEAMPRTLMMIMIDLSYLTRSS